MSDTKDDAAQQEKQADFDLWHLVKAFGGAFVIGTGLTFLIDPNVDLFERVGLALIGLGFWLLGDALESAK